MRIPTPRAELHPAPGAQAGDRAVTLASGVFLACVRNLHGPALPAGVALAAVLGTAAGAADAAEPDPSGPGSRAQR
jgi:hypothetical protein